MNLFHEALEAEREVLNMRFQMARQQFPRLNGVQFLNDLSELVEPVYLSAIKHQPKDTLLQDLYDAALTLTGRGLFERLEVVRRSWTDVLANVGHLVAIAPKQMIAAVTNMICNLESELDEKAHLWIDRMSKAGKPIPDVEMFKQAGVIMAWQCGYTLAREEALRLCQTLNHALVCYLLGMPPQPEEDTWRVLAEMQENIWYKPHQTATSLSLVQTVGGFRGFGGVFFKPPVVSFQQNRLIADDTHQQYELLVDAFGTMFRRFEGTTIEEIETLSPHFYIDEKGNITKRDQFIRYEGLAKWTSAASNEQLMAVTLPDSHLIYLIA